MADEKDIALTHDELDAFLSNYFAYYRSLNQPYKALFITRLIEFVHSKHFVSPKGMALTNRVKAIVSASAIQLTLGLENWKINYFETIILFPSDFKNEISGLKLKGETNLSGFVSLSWKSFIEGYQIPNDNLNLGLHEFTHALRFNGVRGHETDEFFSGYFAKWYSFANAEFWNLKNGGESIFRKYGGVNINEFLSVVVEHFFESPQEFQTHHPDFYSATAILLNQKTDGKTTILNIRLQELEQMNSKFGQLPPFEFRKNFSMASPLICLLITIYTAASSGIFSFPTLFMALLTFLLALRDDFYSTTFRFDGEKIILSKGTLIFKNRSVFSFSAPQLVKVQFGKEENNSLFADLTFFTNEGDFYEETVYLKNNVSEKESLVKFLHNQYVWAK